MENDPVNRPAHYTSGKIEVIDFINDQNLGFELGNTVKYVARAGKKDPSKEIEDLKKAEWYLRRQIENLRTLQKPVSIIMTSDNSMRITKADTMSFGAAIGAAKQGKKVARLGWNGQGMYAYIVPASEFPAFTEIAKKEFGDIVPYRAYWALKTAQNDVAMWAPSGSDSLAEDWIVVE